MNLLHEFITLIYYMNAIYGYINCIDILYEFIDGYII